MPRVSGIIDALPIPSAEKFAFQQRLEAWPHFERALRDNFEITVEMREYSELRVKMPANNIREYYAGVGGIGKSKVGQVEATETAHAAGREFEIEKCYFDLGQLLSDKSSFKAGDVIMQDDPLDVWGTGSRRMTSEFANIAQVVRQYQLSLFSCCTSPKFGDKAHHEYEVLFIDYNDWSKRCLVYKRFVEPNGCADWNPIGWVRVPKAEGYVSSKWLKEYDSKKTEFIETVLGQRGVSNFTDGAEKVLADPRFLEMCRVVKDQLKLPGKQSVLVGVTDELFPELRMNNEAAAITAKALAKALGRRSEILAKVKELHGE